MTTRAGKARRASRPPLMRERCLRTQLISPILAPLRNSARVVACLSAKRDAGRWRDPIGRGAAGQQHQHEIVLSRRVGKCERAFGALEPGFVGDRMAGLDHGDPSGRPAITVTGDGNAVEPLRCDARQIMLFRHFGERACAFAGGQDNEPSVRRRFRQVRRQAARRVRGADRRAEQGFQQFARLRRQFEPSAPTRAMDPIREPWQSVRPHLYLFHS